MYFPTPSRAHLLLIHLALLLFTSVVLADNNTKKEEPAWDVLNPPFELQTVHIETGETTWSSLDVSPDGKHLVFDALGDIFIVDATGGEAQALTQDFAWNIHPTFSPDGKRIAFISDRSGLSNIWVMNVDGSGLKQISQESKHLIHSPKWSPDGDYIVAMKGIMSQRSIPAGEIWLYHHGGGEGVAIKERNGGNKEQKNIADPVFSPDGRYIYFTQDITPGSTFSYNRDPLKSLFAIMRYELNTGHLDTLVSGTGGAVVPTPSPDGKQLAFIRRVKNRTVLFTKDLTSGQETPLYYDLDRDMQEGFGTEGYYPYLDWTPDSEQLVFWASGKFHRLPVASKTAINIPVSLSTRVKLADALRVPVDVAPTEFPIRLMRWAQQSPDGKSVLFQALGKLYLKDIASGKVRRLTRQNDHDEYYPQYSPDGRQIAYVSWNDEELGGLRLVPARGGRGKLVSKQPGHYREPAFSADGKLLTYRLSTGGHLLSPQWSTDPGLYLMNLNSAETTKLTNSGYLPHFSGSNDRVFYTETINDADYPETQLVSVNLQGKDRREHIYGADKISEYRLSPDGKWLAFIHQYKAYVTPFTHTGKRLTIGPDSKTSQVAQISGRAGEMLRWHADSQAVGWTHGPTYYQRALNDTFAFLHSGESELPEPVSHGINLSFSQKTDKPSGYRALVGGTVITMRNANKEQEIIHDATVLIKENRIEAVGPSNKISVPTDALRLDTRGKFIIPGLIDTHAHGSLGSEEIIPQQNWGQYSNLAFGVTTIHDPSNDTTEVFAASELQRSGKIVAPRTYSTGTILYGAESLAHKAVINTAEDADFHLQRMQDVGAISVKSYNQQSRSQRQQVLAAARKLGVMVVPEGGGKFQQNMSMLVDGHTGLEHALPIATAYDDVTQLWAASKFGYTPTFVVAYGGLMGEEYFYDRTEVWKNPRLMAYTPHFLVDSRSIRRPTAPDNQYNHFAVARYAKTLRDQGVTVHIGAHGQREGLAAHWELWIMQQGGFKPWEALRAGTIDGARHLGMDKDLGSIETGKLADLVVIGGDVLNDIRQSEFVSHTVLNGRIYEASSMNEVGSENKRRAFFFEENNQAFMPAQTAQRVLNKARLHHWVH